MSENSAYDVDAPEGAKSPGSQYMSRKDVKWILGATAIVLIGMVPVYFSMRDKAYKVTCTKNMSSIMEAIDLYASDHDDRFPPAFELGEDGEPVVGPEGYPYTWVSEVKAHLTPRASFVCPSADESEYAYSVDPAGGPPIPSTYGYYQAYTTHPSKEVDNPESVILLAETANGGATDSFDPLPFKSTKYDGFVVGWDNSNSMPNESTKAVTRLAFKKTSSQNFNQAEGRHGLLCNAITASRQLLYITSSDAQTQYDRAKYTLGGHWREPIQQNGR